MAALRLGRFELRQSELPPVCMRCGTRASAYRGRVFTWHPWWFYLGLPFGLFPYALLWVFFTRRVYLHAPLCAAHQFHWLWRSGVLLLACALDAGLGLLGWKLFTDPADLLLADHGISMFLLLLALVVGPVVLLVLALALRYSGVHAQEITSTSVSLGGVADEFAEAVRVARGDAEAEPVPAGVRSEK